MEINLKKMGSGYFKLSGGESIIRIIHYIAIRKVSMGQVWLFNSITEEEVMTSQRFINYKVYKKMSPSTKSKFNILSAVYENALKRKYIIDFLDNEVIDLGEAISDKSNNNFSFKYLKESVYDSYSNLYFEQIHFTFLTDFFLQDIKSIKEQELIGEHIKLYHTKNNIVKECMGLLNEVRRYYELPDSTYYLLLYSLCSRLVVIHYFQLHKIIPLSEITDPVTKMERIIVESMEKTLLSYSKFDSFPSIKSSFLQVITGYLQLYVPIKLKVYIDFIYKSEYKYKLENAILRNYNHEILQVTNNYSKADIIISDTFIYESVKYFFYFEDMFDKASWLKLGSYLNQVIDNEMTNNA